MLPQEVNPDSDHVHFKCPVCERKLKVARASAGVVLSCPSCQQPVKVPGKASIACEGKGPSSTSGGPHSKASIWHNRRFVIVIAGLALLGAAFSGFIFRGNTMFAQRGGAQSQLLSTRPSLSIENAPNARVNPSTDRSRESPIDAQYAEYRERALEVCDGVDKLVLLSKSNSDTLTDYKDILSRTESLHRSFMGSVTPAQLRLKSRSSISEAVRTVQALGKCQVKCFVERQRGSKEEKLNSLNEMEAKFNEPVPEELRNSERLAELLQLRENGRANVARLRQSVIEGYDACDAIPKLIGDATQLTTDARTLLGCGL